MSIFGLKDLDYYFAAFLDDDDIFNLEVVNKYYNEIFKNDFFWKRRFYQFFYKDINLKDKYINSNKINWKKYYRSTCNFLLENNLILFINT
jgi:hypothetical protein